MKRTIIFFLRTNRILHMKRCWGILFLILALVLVSCSDSATDNDNVSLCNVTLSYGSMTASSSSYMYGGVVFGLDNNENNEWTIYDQSLFVSLDNKNWSTSSTSSFSVPRGTETFYLKGIAHCINLKGQRCMAISIYKNKDRLSKSSYLE